MMMSGPFVLTLLLTVQTVLSEPFVFTLLFATIQHTYTHRSHGEAFADSWNKRSTALAVRSALVTSDGNLTRSDDIFGPSHGAGTDDCGEEFCFDNIDAAEDEPDKAESFRVTAAKKKCKGDVVVNCLEWLQVKKNFQEGQQKYCNTQSADYDEDETDKWTNQLGMVNPAYEAAESEARKAVAAMKTGSFSNEDLQQRLNEVAKSEQVLCDALPNWERKVKKGKKGKGSQKLWEASKGAPCTGSFAVAPILSADLDALLSLLPAPEGIDGCTGWSEAEK